MPLVGRLTLHITSLMLGGLLCAAAAVAQQPLKSIPSLPIPPFPTLPPLPSLPYSPYKYDLVLSGGHVLDPKNHRDGVMEIGIKDGRVTAVQPHIPAADTIKLIQLHGLYLTPGLVDIHVHAYAGTGEKASYAGDNSLYPDGFTLRVGVTTVADAGCAGWRNFEDFKDRVIDRSKTRVLAFLNIVGHGMRGGAFEQDLADMASAPAAEMARKHP